ncbi:MAG: GNAT family N-acetyltransferase [Clostridia bacterium]|nr:GNAT family N-acetyltransferase [Clostridia bacterium]
MTEIVSVRERPEYADKAIAFFQRHWASDASRPVYEDCIRHCVGADGSLPQWYLLLKDSEIIGGAGLITNDFISRMDLCPWICALYIEEPHRGHAYGQLLLERAAEDAGAAGFNAVYLCTDHIGYYERYGFAYIGTGYHPWGETSRIYKRQVKGQHT